MPLRRRQPCRCDLSMSEAPTQNPKVSTATWRANKPLSISLRFAVFLVPLIAGWLAVRAVSDKLYQPLGFWGLALWAVQALVVGSVVATAVDRLSRRLLPLSTLYGLSLIFPDEAPSRFSVALRLGSTKKLQREMQAITDNPTFVAEAPQLAAERALVLVALLSRHDRLTRGHSERVRAYVDLIAEEMKMPAHERAKLSWAALLHDVGKLKVAPEILNSPDKPTEQEWAILSEHPGHGADLLRSLYEWLGDAFGAATEHHERWDGTGYPQRLERTEISLAGRITAVADAYDTMTSVRSYKSAHSPDSARRELVECSGTQFDPDVVRAFLNVSLGRRWMAGPLTWITEIPGLSINALGAVPAATASVLLAIAAAVGAVNRPIESQPPAELAAVESQADSTTTTTEPTTTTELSAATTHGIVTTTAEPTETTQTTTSTSVAPETTTTTQPTTTTAPKLPATTAAAQPAPPTSAPATTAGPIAYPSATNDFYTVESGSWVNMSVLRNDSEGDFAWDYSTLDLYTEPENGRRWEVIADKQRVRYRSRDDFVGTDFFKYVICNEGGHCAIGTVTIKVIDEDAESDDG